MSPRVIRALMFLAMVASGLLVVLLLSEPFGGRRTTPVIGELADDEGPRVKIVGQDRSDETQILLGEVDFVVVHRVEVEPGVFADRNAYRVHMSEGSPDDTGAFLAKNPVITLLDSETGEDAGQVSADDARFETDDAAGGNVTIDFNRMHARTFALMGNVQGEFPMADGTVARLRAGSLNVDGDLIEAPGFVTWTRGETLLSGYDMSWDGTIGRLDFVSDADLRLHATADEPERSFHAPGGLTWTVPPDAEDPNAEATGELRGHVTGTSGDGSRLSAETLFFDSSQGRVRMVGGSVYERIVDGRSSRLSAQHIQVESDEQGRLAIAEADGEVRLVSTPLAVVPAWMVADTMRLEGETASSPGRVTWSRDALVAVGTEMAWDGLVGRLAYARDAELAVDEGSAHAWAGLRLLAPDGMTWAVPPEATDPALEATGEMRGRVTGTLPDGTTVATDFLFFDGPSRTFELQGSAVFEQRSDDRYAQLEARRITVQADDDGRIALVSAQGDVVVLHGPIDVMPTRLSSSRIDRRDRLYTSPGVVTWEREDITVVGTGMTWDEGVGRLDFTRDTHITFLDPNRRLELALEADGGLTWTMPGGAMTSWRQGRGVLRGRVTGQSSDGSELEADRVLMDGPTGTLTLLGDASVELTGDGRPVSLTSESIVVESLDSEARLSTELPAEWTHEGLSGAGVGLVWDQATGQLHVDREVTLDVVDAEGARLWAVSASGSLDWTVPPGAADPMLEGRGEIVGDVVGEAPGLGHFTADVLTLDGGNQVNLLGNATFWREDADTGHMQVAALDRIVLHTDADGRPHRLTAEGDAQAVLRAPGAVGPTRLGGRSLMVDRDKHEFSVHGDARVERHEGDDVLYLRAADRILARTDELDELIWLEADGSVVFDHGFEAEGDRLTWDVPADLAMLTGNCRLRAPGAWMRAELVELQPRAQSFRILQSVVELDG